MQRLTVDSSSHIVSVGYDKPTKTLEVEFTESLVYQYFDVPQEIYDGLLKAKSVGQYFYAYINKQFRYKQVRDDITSKTLAFATGNAKKFSYCQAACQEAQIEVEQLDLEVDEIQSDDPAKIAIAKAKAAYRLARRPILANDLYWSITALKGFPGAYAKDVDGWLSSEDLLNLMNGRSDRTTVCTETLVYYDGKLQQVFSHSYWGKITDQPRGSGKSLMRLVQLDGNTETISEIEERGGYPYTSNPSIWSDFTKWYKLQKRMKRI